MGFLKGSKIATKVTVADRNGEEKTTHEPPVQPPLKKPTKAVTNPTLTKKTVINPSGPFMRKWDLFMVALLMFTACVTPFEVAFLSPSVDALFVVNRLVDSGFIMDMGLNFFVGYIDSETGQWVWDRRKIAQKYLTGWFFIDLISILPFDLMGLVMQSGTVSQLKVLRIVRLLRLIKLLRVFRSSRIFRRIQMSMGMAFSTFSMFKLLAYVLAVVHWTACLWNLGPSLEDGGVSWRSELAAGWAPGELYLACLEFSLQAMVMGYGDFVPVTHWERGIAVFCMVVGGSVYAYVIGDICGVVSNRDPATSEYQQNVDLLNLYMTENQIPQELRVKLREYFVYCKDLLREQYYTALLDQMSPELQKTVAHFRNGPWIARISFFNAKDIDERQAFVTAVSAALKPEAYSPQEVIFREGDHAQHLYIVTRGLVGSRGRIVKKQDFFGTDMIAGLIMENARRIHSARSLTFLDVNSLGREELENLLEEGDFPETSVLIRRAAIGLAFRRTIISLTKQYRAETGMPASTAEEREAWKAAMAEKAKEKKARAVRRRAEDAEARSRANRRRFRKAMLANTAAIGGKAEEGADDPDERLARVARKRQELKDLGVIAWWNRERAGQDPDCLNGLPKRVIVSEVQSPQIDELRGEVARLERVVLKLAAAMDKGFGRLEAAQATLYRTCRRGGGGGGGGRGGGGGGGGGGGRSHRKSGRRGEGQGQGQRPQHLRIQQQGQAQAQGQAEGQGQQARRGRDVERLSARGSGGGSRTPSPSTSSPQGQQAVVPPVTAAAAAAASPPSRHRHRRAPPRSVSGEVGRRPLSRGAAKQGLTTAQPSSSPSLAPIGGPAGFAAARSGGGGGLTPPGVVAASGSPLPVAHAVATATAVATAALSPPQHSGSGGAGGRGVGNEQVQGSAQQQQQQQRGGGGGGGGGGGRRGSAVVTSNSR